MAGFDTSCGPADFSNTHWSLILTAKQNGSPEGEIAMARLCEIYTYPVYAFIRRGGVAFEDAKDLTQEFFARLLAKDFLSAVDPAKGRFRCFLLTCVQRFLSNERAKAKAVKRGGQCTFVSLDETIEDRYRAEPVDPVSPEDLYDLRWALTVIEGTLRQLRAEYVAAGKQGLFEGLEGFLSGTGESSYAAAAPALGLSEAATRQAAFRLRRRYRELLYGTLTETLRDPAELEEELNYLRAALARANTKR